MKHNENKFEFVFYVYFIFMLLFYIGYILLDTYRLTKSDRWLSKSSLTEEDVESINRLGMWTESFEIVFLVLFILMMSITVIRYRKNNKSIIALKRFLKMNIVLFIGIIVISFALVLMTPLPIGNLLQPLLVPAFLMGVLFIYMLWEPKIKRE